MSKAFNVFLGGTCSRMDFLGQVGKAAGFPEGELIAWLAETYKKTGKTEFKDYLALNGVGTGNRDHHKYDPRFQKKYSDLEGIVGGYGSDEIRDSVVALIKNKKMTKVNLIGWSRGGYNAIRIANKLFEECPAVQVNILSFDPVPGSGNRTEDCLTLQRNVKKYFSFLALHEHTVGFQPIYPQPARNNTETECLVRTLPGNHSAAVGGLSGKLTAPQLKPLADLTRMIALQSLIEMGVREYQPVFDALNQLQSLEKRLEAISNNASEYKKLENHTIIYGGFASSNPVRSADGHISHYRHLCVGAGPSNWKFMNDIPACRHNVLSEYDKLFEIYPDTCSFHRDFNDFKIASEINDVLESYQHNIRADDLQKLRKLTAYLESRHQMRGEDPVLLQAVTQVRAQVAQSIADFLQRHARQPKPYDSFKTGVDGIEASAIDPETIKQTFFLAAQSGNLYYLDFILNNSWCIVQDHSQSLHMLNDATLLLDAKTADGQTALMLAAKNGHLDFIKRLLGNQLDFYQQKFAAMIVAMQMRQRTVAEYLLKALQQDDFDLCEIEMDEEQIKILLIWSIENAQHKLTGDLLTLHPEFVSARLNEQGTTSLMLAAHHGHTSLISDLLISDPRCFLRLDNENLDAYQYALLANQQFSIKMLQKKHEARVDFERRFELEKIDDEILDLDPPDIVLDLDPSGIARSHLDIQIQVALPTMRPFLNARRKSELVSSAVFLGYAGTVGLESLGKISLASAIEPIFAASSFVSPVALIALAACALVVLMLTSEVVYSYSSPSL